MSIQYFETLLKDSTIENIAGWLRSLSTEERKALGKDLKPLSKAYTAYEEVRDFNGSISFKQKANLDQQKILVLANFVCLSRADFEKSYIPGWIFDRNIINHVIEWHHPEWLGDFGENLVQKTQLFYLTDYLFLAGLEEKGYIELKPGIVCQTIINAIYEQVEGYTFNYKPENLLKYPITLGKHVWWLFEHESNIHYSGRWIRFADGSSGENQTWINLFTRFIEEGRLDRGRVLEEALLASNKNFNKVLSGWFIDLVEALKPTEEELLEMQPVICTLLNAQQSKPVNYALNVFKKIAVLPGFNATQFLDNAQVLMTSSIKSIVSGTLMVFEKLSKKQPDQTGTALQIAANGFVQQDAELQTKIAKFIVKNGNGFEEQLTEALVPYRDNLLSEAKAILKPFIQSEGTLNRDEKGIHDLPESGRAERVWEQIPSFDNFDDLLFLCSRAFESKDAWYADLLPAALVQNREAINEQNADSFAPALKRTFQLSYTSPSMNTSILDFLLMTFFSDICIILVRRYPDHTKTLQSVFRENEEKYQKGRAKWLAIDERTSFTERYPLSNYHEFYRLFQRVLVIALHFFKNNINLPLISTPTHQPSWIDPETLIHRLCAYEAAGYKPDILDFQMGMARCNLAMVVKSIPSLEKLKNPEYKGLLRFLFGLQNEPDKTLKTPELWFMASLCRPEKEKFEVFRPYGYYDTPFANYTGGYDFETTTTSEYSKFIASFLPAGEKPTLEHKIFQLLTPEEEKKELSFFSKLKSKLNLNKPQERVLPEFMQINQGYLGQTATDLGRALLITPNNMGPLLAGVAAQCLKSSKFWESTDSHAVQASIEVLHQTGCIAGKMAHVFVATTMICNNKTSSGVAAEIWIEGVEHNTIDSALLGRILGTNYRVDYAPLKRLTDLMQTRMFNISSTHNKALLTLIENLLPELPDTPPSNLKKLLELYNEVISLGGKKGAMPHAILQKLEIWQKTKSLEGIVKAVSKHKEGH
jgi:Family of unknown function (DUF6493)